jgi:glucitol/sorbitol PTS system EIIA component
MTYYESTVLRAGGEAADMVGGGVLILFADPIPDALEDVSVVHAPAGPPTARMEPGHVLSLGGQRVRLSKVGELADENLRTLGHVVVYVEPGDDTPLLPGAVHATGLLTAPEPGAVLTLAVTP